VTLAIPKPVIGEWDRDRLEQVLINLLTNSSRYGAGKPILISVHEAQDQAEIRVRDHGRGIAKIDQERIFNRYERAISSNEVSGLGLGLFIVKEMLEKNKGSIKVESELGLGATFIINLPIQRDT
jgi:signal transduction histidine kinase